MKTASVHFSANARAERRDGGLRAPLRDRPPSYLELLRQGATPPDRVPYLELLRRGTVEREQRHADRMAPTTLQAVRHNSFDTPLRQPLADLLAHTLAQGRDRISGREIFWRLRIPPNREACEKRAIARLLRSLGWVRVRYGPQGKRIWGWRWREWNVTHVKIDLKS